jgi:DNA-binding NarL/FixJ family response regulator
MQSKTEVQEILVLEPDRLCGAIVAQTVSRLFPNARVHCETEPSVAAVLLAEHAIDLFIVALRGFDLDVITLLGVWADHDANYTRVLIVTPDVNSAALRTIERLPVMGVFDSSRGDLRDLEDACRAVASGHCFPRCGRDVAPGNAADDSTTDAAFNDAVRVDVPNPGRPVNSSVPRWRQ